MTRLPSALHRLYLVDTAADLAGPNGAAPLIDSSGRVRAMVMSLARPADWSLMSMVWRAVQSDLGLPAPAIAVSGHDAYQLWFSLLEPVPVADARAFVEALHLRYLGDLAPARISVFPCAFNDTDSVQHAFRLPPQEVFPEQWSAFVAPDLAPMFAETAWLDVPPSPDGQADLLSAVQSIKPAAWHAALQQLQPPVPTGEPAVKPARPQALQSDLDPGQFLLDVLNDETVALALRIEAAKALLLGGFPSIVVNGGRPGVGIATNKEGLIKGA